MELWYQFLFIAFFTQLSSASVYGDTLLVSDKPVTDTCHLELMRQLDHQHNLTSAAREQVVKKDATIRQLSRDVVNTKDMLKLVTESAQQQNETCITRDQFQQQMAAVHRDMAAVNRDTAAVNRDMANIVNLTTEINNVIRTPSDQVANLEKQVARLEMELLTANDTINRLSDQLHKNRTLTKDESADNQKKLDIFKRKYNLTADNDVMIKACKIGDLSVVTALLDQGVSTEVRTVARTCLQWAAENNHIDIARLLVDRGADVDVIWRGTWTPLMYTAYYGYLEIAKIVVSGGADLTLKSNTNSTALGYAIRYKKQDLIDYLKSIHAPE